MMNMHRARNAAVLALCWLVCGRALCDVARVQSGYEYVLRAPFNGTLIFENRGTGIVRFEAEGARRLISIRCSALSLRGARSSVSWIQLVLASDIPGIEFKQQLPIDNATRITSPELTGTLNGGQAGTIRVVHSNQGADADDLSCRVVVDQWRP